MRVHSRLRAIATFSLVVAMTMLAPTAGTAKTTTETADRMTSDHQPPFVAQIHRIDPATGERMKGTTWEPGCPVRLGDLRTVQMRYWGFDSEAHMGRIVVHADVAESVVRAFEKMYEEKFPIQRMEPVAAYDGDDDASMAANNTSSFNCRPITGSPDRWSIHSYGRAIDINPVQNPYVSGSTVLPEAGREYLDRSDLRHGMIPPGSVARTAFAAEGFDWGGDWTSLKDYQHFEIQP